MKAAEDTEKTPGITSAQIEEWEEAVLTGNFDALGTVRKIEVGRPLKFGEPLKYIGYKEVASITDAMDKRARALGMSRSDYIRNLVRQDLAAV